VLLDVGIEESVLGSVKQVGSGVKTVTCWGLSHKPVVVMITTHSCLKHGVSVQTLLPVVHPSLLPLVLPLLLLQRAPELSCISVQERVEPLLQCLLQSLQLQPEDLRVMLLRCPRLLSFSTQRHVLPVVAFLREELGFDDAQVASTLRRFPGIMG
jgi:hypothetical protein